MMALLFLKEFQLEIMSNLVFSLVVNINDNYLVIEKNDSVVNFIINNFTKTYKKPSIPTLLEIRDSINSINKTQTKYLKLNDTLKIKDILNSIGKFKLYDIHIIYLLAYLSYNFNLNFDIYCAVKYSKNFKNYLLFDMGSVYGTAPVYMCYPILVIDDYYIIGSRKMYVLNRISDFERFPDELFSIEIPELKNQMEGYKLKLIKSEKR